MTALKDAYFTISQAAEELHVSRQTISRWIARGKITAEKVGRVTLIKKEDLFQYEDRRLQARINDIVVKRLINRFREE